MIALKFSEVFSKKGTTKRTALKLIKQQFPDAKWYNSIAVVDKKISEIKITPGVSEYGDVKIVETNFEKIAKAAEPFAKKVFWLDVKRIGNHEFTSVDAAKVIGKLIEKTGKKANSSGDKINIEIQGDTTLVFSKNIGLSGLPLGLFGKMLILHEGDQNSEIALLKVASKGFSPIVLCPKGFTPSLGEVFHYNDDLINKEISHSLIGLKGPLKKMFLLKLAKTLQERVGAVDTVCGDSLNNGFSSDHKLLKILYEISGLKPLLPLGFENENKLNKFARSLGLNLEKNKSELDWKRFKLNELDSEWTSLELEKLLRTTITKILKK